jgi:hypothetical protein
VLLALSLLAAGAAPALAAWPSSPYVNLPVCTAPNLQGSVQTLSDGLGGVFLVWTDNRAGLANGDVYAQHVTAAGIVDPAWPANGLGVCTNISNQSSGPLVSDGGTGFITTWTDYRSGSADVYAQHILVTGVADPAWPVNGRAVCSATLDQYASGISADGAGGAILSWSDLRVSGNSYDIYAQHVLASGAVDPAWPVDGRALCIQPGIENTPLNVSDGAGGAIVLWTDNRVAGSSDIYAQRVLASGAVDPAWPVDGRAVCTAAGTQSFSAAISDGAGGAFISWSDGRPGTTGTDLYAQHLLVSGVVDPNWPTDGRGVCTAAGFQYWPAMVSDGAGGMVIAWMDYRSGGYDIYAQHVYSTGASDPAWPVDGRALCLAAGDQYYPVAVSDGLGGAIVSWWDLRSGTYDVYAQHVLPGGAVDGTWPTDGRAVSVPDGAQNSVAIVSDGAGGAILAWVDGRGGVPTDIYAQRVARFGYLGTPEGEIVGVKDVPGDNGGKVKLSWNASYLDLNSDANLVAYDVLRSVPPNVAQARLQRGERPATTLAEAADGSRMLTLPDAAQGYYWELLGSVNALHYVSGYSYIASTLGDSIGAGNPKTAFMVVARNSANTLYWPSRPDSGYSVDNIPPVTPAPFAANYSAGTTHLHWQPNPDADLANYRLYRGIGAFTIGPASLLATPADTGYADLASATYTYKLTAVDVHGNESPVATITPGGIAGVDGGAVPRELALAPASPNPAAGGTTLRFALPVPATASLGIYDAAGRLVRTLAGGAQAAGEHAVTWNLQDAGGRNVGAGLYFARLEAGGRTLVQRIAVTP